MDGWMDGWMNGWMNGWMHGVVLIRSLDGWMDSHCPLAVSCAPVAVGTLSHFFDFFFGNNLLAQKSHVFDFGTIFGNSNVHLGPFWVPKRGPRGHFFDIFGGSGAGLNFGPMFRLVFKKKTLKNKKWRSGSRYVNYVSKHTFLVFSF